MAKGAGLGMARRVRVWNRGERLFDYLVNGDRVTIAPGAFIETARAAANNIQGFYPGKDVPVCIELEPIIEEESKADNPQSAVKKEKVYACPYCDFESKLKMAYQNHVKTHKEALNDSGAVGS